MSKILIPNATSPKNAGDLAILVGLLSLLSSHAKLVIHSSESRDYKKILKYEVDETLYFWTIFENKNEVSRIIRLTCLLINYFSLKFFNFILFGFDKQRKLINDYRDADLIIFVGGGYLRSQKGISQTLNLLMTLLMFQFAKITNAKKVVAPISFGPFAYKWQEKYAANILKNLDVVSVRENYSFDLLEKYKVKNLIKSSDTAFLLKLKQINKNKKFTLGFTIRKWLDDESQIIFEEEFIKAIVKYSKTREMDIQPIIQVDAPEYGDFDAKLTLQISDKLSNQGLTLKPAKKVLDLSDSVQIYGEINLLLGMRMHSNILAATQGTPFVAISYEYKTDGIANDLGVEEYCIKVEAVTGEKLYALLMKADKSQVYLNKTINNSLARIRKEETKRWSQIFQNYN